MKEPVSIAWIDWHLAGRTVAVQSLGRFLFLCVMAFALVALQLSGGLARFASSQYAVTAMLHESASPEEAEGLARKISRLPPVRSAEYRDPAAAFKELLSAYPGIESMPGAGKNPVPGYIEVRFRPDRFSAADVESVLAVLRPVDLVEKLLTGGGFLHRFFRAQRAFAILAWGMFAALAVLFFVLCRLQERLRILSMRGDIGFLLEHGVSERRIAVSRAAAAAIWGLLLAAAAASAAAAAVNLLLRRYPFLENVIGTPQELLSARSAAYAGVFLLSAAILFAASSLLGGTTDRSAGN